MKMPIIKKRQPNAFKPHLRMKNGFWEAIILRRNEKFIPFTVRKRAYEEVAKLNHEITYAAFVRVAHDKNASVGARDTAFLWLLQFGK